MYIVIPYFANSTDLDQKENEATRNLKSGRGFWLEDLCFHFLRDFEGAFQILIGKQPLSHQVKAPLKVSRDSIENVKVPSYENFTL